MEREISSAASFINLDLELTYSGSLNPLVSYFGNKVFVLFNGENEVGNLLCVEPLFEGNLGSSMENCVNHFVQLIKGLPPELAEIWALCGTRVFDFGFEGGYEQPPFQASFSSATLREISKLNIEIRITIYPFSEGSEIN